MNWLSRLFDRLKKSVKASCADTCCERMQIDCRQGRDCPYRVYGANVETRSELPPSIRRRK